MKTLAILAVYLLIKSDVHKVDGLETFMDRAWRSEWCNEEQFGANHTMCIYQEGAQSACGHVGLPGLPSQDEKDTIVKLHNKLRARIANGKENRGVDGPQPRATNMRKLVWSNELAEVAQRWVDQCAGEHDCNRRTEKYPMVGQNWAARHDGKHDKIFCDCARKIINGWYDEVANISLQTVSSYSSDQSKTGSSGVINHYTQVVWAETAEVGCGYMAHLVNRRYERVLVCNYGPAGNIEGALVYEQGETGSNCPKGTTKTPLGLCANDEN